MIALLGPVERVEGAALRVDRRLLRVLVLRLGPIGRRLARSRREDAPAEGDRAAGGVADREQHAGPEEVLRPAAPVDEAEARVGQDVLGQLQRLGQGVPVVGRPAQPELAHDVAVVAARAQVVAGRAGVGRAQQPLVVPVDGLLHGVEQLGAPLVVAPHLLVLVQRDAGPVGQEADGVDEVEVVHGPHEGDGVARLLAAEAVVEALLGVDAERRRLLGVEGAQPAPAPAHLLERGVLADERPRCRWPPGPGPLPRPVSPPD